MFPVADVWVGLVPPLIITGVVPLLVYDAFIEERKAIYNFSVSVLKTFKEQIPLSCWKKQGDIQVLNCFLRNGHGAALISQKESPEFIRDLEAYQEHNRSSRKGITTAAALLFLSTIQILATLSIYYCYCRPRYITAKMANR